MSSSIFRQSSIDRLKSPEQLNDYIRVASPGVWLLLSAVVLLLTGVIVWGIFGTVESKIQTGVVVEKNVAYCYVSESDVAGIENGMEVIVGQVRGSVKGIASYPSQMLETDSYQLHLSHLEASEFAYLITIELSGLAEGIYQGEIVQERIHPIHFVIQ